MRINIPNQITLGRLGASIVFFVLLSLYSHAREPGGHWLLPACFWLYLIAALSDALDGYLARKWHQETSFGRVVDPVADKVMVCGAFVFFASSHFADPDPPHKNVTGVEAWMVVLILLRELLVSALRSFSESHGRDFSANWVGKIKSFVQFTTVCVILGVLAWFEKSLWWLRVACVWATVIVTALSIISYLQRAYSFVLSESALGGRPTSPPETAAPAPKGASA
jgi:CDP-diacylglycerol--glycerol-3-phosphate 3-phosphatidyltransferase